MAETVKLFVNGQEVEVPAGKNLIDAVTAVGIEIPHFCYHPALGADGNCRMCLVGIEDGRPPLVPACKTPAQAGMKVLLDVEKIKKIQHDVMELELINHPIDCPICDQAGECTLQDYYMSYDRQPSRMRVKPVAKKKNLDFGCGVVHDQERCVLCARCVRFTRLITKTGELGIVNRSDEARVSTFPGRPLNNRYALNVVDLCPVGAMTSRDFRFKQRAWFLQREKGICHGCAKGCNIFIDHNREKYKDDIIYRFRPRHNALVNGYFICDEGRLSYHQENEGRLSQARIDAQPADFSAALQVAQQRLDGANKILLLFSPNCTLEQITAFQLLAKHYKASCSGYSDAYIKTGDGDDYLIRDDKSANRKGLQLLGVDTSAAFFMRELAAADLIFSINNDLFRNDGGEKITALLAGKSLIALSTHENQMTTQAAVCLPFASYSEDSGTIVNEDGVLQRFTAAVSKNAPPKTAIEIAVLLGVANCTATTLWQEIQRAVPRLAAVAVDSIPEQGLPLSHSEESHVSA